MLSTLYNNNGKEIFLRYMAFSLKNYSPIAVGGVAGLMIAGKILNVYQGQSIYVENTVRDSIEYVGGIVGMLNKYRSSANASLENIIVDADILLFSFQYFHNHLSNSVVNSWFPELSD